jgi:hypothetical protein
MLIVLKDHYSRHWMLRSIVIRDLRNIGVAQILVIPCEAICKITGKGVGKTLHILQNLGLVNLGGILTREPRTDRYRAAWRQKIIEKWLLLRVGGCPNSS